MTSDTCNFGTCENAERYTSGYCGIHDLLEQAGGYLLSQPPGDMQGAVGFRQRSDGSSDLMAVIGGAWEKVVVIDDVSELMCDGTYKNMVVTQEGLKAVDCKEGCLGCASRQERCQQHQDEAQEDQEDVDPSCYMCAEAPYVTNCRTGKGICWPCWAGGERFPDPPPDRPAALHPPKIHVETPPRTLVTCQECGSIHILAAAKGKFCGNPACGAELKPEFRLMKCANCQHKAQYTHPVACLKCATRGFLYPVVTAPMLKCDHCGRTYQSGTDICDWSIYHPGKLSPMTEGEQKAWEEQRASVGEDPLTRDKARAKGLNGLFEYHDLTEYQKHVIDDLREGGARLAQSIDSDCPRSADRTAAVRLLQDAVSTAIRSIALQGKGYRDYESKED